MAAVVEHLCAMWGFFLKKKSKKKLIFYPVASLALGRVILGIFIWNFRF
jgi:hypothetical protein